MGARPKRSWCLLISGTALSSRPPADRELGRADLVSVSGLSPCGAEVVGLNGWRALAYSALTTEVSSSCNACAAFILRPD